MSVDVESTTGTEAPSQPRVAQSRIKPPRSIVGAVWDWTWPKLVAIGLVLLVWQYLYWTEWRPHLVLPSPINVGRAFWAEITGQHLPGSSFETHLWSSIETTMKRALTGYSLALVIGTVLGVAVVQWSVFRRGVGSLLAGLQTMPSIAWFPLAILLFGITEKAILFVVILGSAPSIASGVITGIDEVPPPLLRAGKMLGAKGLNRYRHIVLPAAMPAYIQGMKQGWAFSWRSLLAGELLVQVAGTTSIGSDMHLSQQNLASSLTISLMIVILIIGMIVDGIFSFFTKRIRSNRGLTGAI